MRTEWSSRLSLAHGCLHLHTYQKVSFQSDRCCNFKMSHLRSSVRFAATRLEWILQSELGGMKLYTKLITVVSLLTSLSLPFSLTHTHLLSYRHKHIHTHTHKHTHTHAHTHTRTHTHTNTHTHTPTCSPNTLLSLHLHPSQHTQHHLGASRQITLFTAELWIRTEGISQMVCSLCDDMIVIQFNSLCTLQIPTRLILLRQ